MTEKYLLKKLNNAKKISPNEAWLVSNRELFLSQISNSGAEELNPRQSFYINLRSLAKTLSRPAIATLAFLFVLLTSSVFAYKFFSQAKPNDSLYIARVISEKAKLNTVLDSKTRDELAVKFAASHAKEISEVLANPEFNTEDNQAEVDKLCESFAKEIEKVESRMTSLAMLSDAKKSAKNSETTPAKTKGEVGDNKATSSTSSKGETGEDESLYIEEEDGEIVIAAHDAYKTEQGLDLYINPNADNSSEEDGDSNASTSEEIVDAFLNNSLNEADINSSLISEAKELFEAGKLDAATFKEVSIKLEKFLNNK